MALAHIAVLSVAFLTLLGLPCAVAALIHTDQSTLRRHRQRQRRSSAGRERAETYALRRLDHALRDVQEIPPLFVAEGPTIEQIAFDLRRLDRQRRYGPTLESERWREAVIRAYDARLCLACRRLGLTEHLEPLEGMDRDIERVRVEGELQAAGLALRA